MADYVNNPNIKPDATAGTVRGTPEVLMTKNNSEYVRFKMSIHRDAQLRTVTVFDKNAVKEAKQFADKDVVVVAGAEEKVVRDGKEYFNFTANFCCSADKAYAALNGGHVTNPAPAAEAPASSAWTDIKDDDLPFG